MIWARSCVVFCWSQLALRSDMYMLFFILLLQRVEFALISDINKPFFPLTRCLTDILSFTDYSLKIQGMIVWGASSRSAPSSVSNALTEVIYIKSKCILVSSGCHLIGWLTTHDIFDNKLILYGEPKRLSWPTRINILPFSISSYGRLLGNSEQVVVQKGVVRFLLISFLTPLDHDFCLLHLILFGYTNSMNLAFGLNN